MALKLIIDTREQTPLVFPKVKDVEVVVQGLPVGDYGALHGEDPDSTIFERKSVADLFTSFSGNYKAEREKILRAKAQELTYVLAIEGTATDILAGHMYWKDGEAHESRKSGLAMIRQLMTLQRKYALPVWFCAGRREMAWRIQEYFLAQERNEAPYYS